MFGEPVRSASRTSGKQATTPRVAREVWAVLIAAVLVSLSFWWETAYEFKHAYYIDIESREKPLDAPWHKPILPIMGDFNGDGEIELVYAIKNRVSAVRYDEDRIDAVVLSRFDLPEDQSVLALVSPPGGLTKHQPYIVVVSAVEPMLKAVVESAAEQEPSSSDDETNTTEKEFTGKFSNFNAKKAVATTITFTCLELPRMDTRVWSTSVPFSVELANLWQFYDESAPEEEKKKLQRALARPFHFEATGIMLPTVALHKGDPAGALIVSISIDDDREPFLFAIDMGEGKLRWKQHIDTEETLQEEKPEREASVDEGAGGYKAAYDHSFKFEAVVREAEQSAHMQEIHWRQFRRDMLRFQSSYDGSFGSVLPHSYFTLDALMSPNLLPVFIDDQEQGFHRASLFVSRFDPPGRQPSRRLDPWLDDYSNPNVIVMHHRFGVNVIHLYTGRVLTYLPMQVNRLYADLDGTGTVDAISVDTQERVLEVQDAFNGISFAGIRQIHRFNTSLDDSHVPPLEAMILAMRHASVDHDSPDQDFRMEMIAPPLAIHPDVKTRIFGEGILGDYDETKQLSVAGVGIGTGASGSAKSQKKSGWTTLVLDGRGELIAISHLGRVTFRLMTDASWRPHSEHSVLDHLPALYGFCLHDQRHCSPERWDAVVAVGFDTVVVVSGGKILASSSLPLSRHSERWEENKQTPQRQQPSAVYFVGGDINNDGTNDVVLVFEHSYLGLLLETRSSSFFPVMIGSFALTLIGMLIFKVHGVGGSADVPSLHD